MGWVLGSSHVQAIDSRGPQCIPEYRAALLTLKRLCRSRGNFPRHRIILGDAMGVALVVTKGRSPSPFLLSICRQWCALCLAANIYAHVRWAPSQHSSADDPSRNRSRNLVDSNVAEAQVSGWETRKATKIGGLSFRNSTGVNVRIPVRFK